MYRILIIISVLLTSISSFAQTSGFIVQDGFVVCCNDAGDAGHRAFRLTVGAKHSSKIELKIDTLICVVTNNTAVLMPTTLSTPLVFQNPTDIITTEITQATLVITNNEITQELLKININGGLTSQLVFIDSSLLTEKSVDLTIMGLEVTKKNGLFSYQESVFGGHYRLVNLN